LEFERIFDRVGGHPALLAELARSSGDLPPSAEAIVEDWIARLPRDAVHALRVIATLGGLVTPRSLVDLAFLGRSELGAALGDLERIGLIREDGGVIHAYTVWSDAALATHGRADRFAINID